MTDKEACHAILRLPTAGHSLPQYLIEQALWREIAGDSHYLTQSVVKWSVIRRAMEIENKQKKHKRIG